jgi:hypothetical protein
MTNPKALEIVVPADKKDPDTQKPEVPEERVLKILVTGEDRLYYYQGSGEDVELTRSDYSDKGIRKVIARKQKEALNNPKLIQQGIKERNLIVMIKMAADATHGNFVDIIDEMKITDQGRYMLVDFQPVELGLVHDYEKNKGLESSIDEELTRRRKAGLPLPEDLKQGGQPTAQEGG